MPNWCYNTLIVSGLNEDLQAWKAKLDNNPEGFLSAYYPVDQTEDWYVEHVSKWGTKWDVPLQAVQLVEELEDSYQVQFETAWSPPVPWLVKVAADYPELYFDMRYIEEGMGYLGATVVQGKVDAVVETDELPPYPDDNHEDAYIKWNEKCFELRDRLAEQAEELFNQRKYGA